MKPNTRPYRTVYLPFQLTAYQNLLDQLYGITLYYGCLLNEINAIPLREILVVLWEMGQMGAPFTFAICSRPFR